MNAQQQEQEQLKELDKLIATTARLHYSWGDCPVISEEASNIMTRLEGKLQGLVIAKRMIRHGVTADEIEDGSEDAEIDDAMLQALLAANIRASRDRRRGNG